MSDSNFHSGQIMVRINGPKIRHIREEKGLTQLYIATFVEVTTDTVSRWENKRYPSIKKENGLRLAEALEVPLEEILDSDSHTVDNQPAGPTAQHSIKIRLKTFLMFAPLFILVIASALYFLHRDNSDTQMADISVQRIIPPHFVPGQVLPVFISISIPDRSAVSVILKEFFPPQAEVRSTFPEISDKQLNEKSITWLTKASGPTVFLYTVVSNNTFQGRLDFTGSAKIGSENQAEIPVTGNNSSTAGLHHWADRNRDNRISDEEILAVYDLIDTDAISLLDIDLVEEIWLGDGYRWQPVENNFVIIE